MSIGAIIPLTKVLEDGSNQTLNDAQSYADNGDSQTLNDAQSYADSLANNYAEIDHGHHDYAPIIHIHPYLGISGKAADSSKLNGAIESVAETEDTIVKRDAYGRIKTSVLLTYTDGILVGWVSGYYISPTNNHVDLTNSYADKGLKIYNDGRAVFDAKVYATDFEQSSDRRLKKKIKKLKVGIDGLKPVSFEFRDKDIKGLQYGFIAQDMAETHSELVSMDRAGMLSIKQNSIIALLVKEVQELKKEVKSLTSNYL